MNFPSMEFYDNRLAKWISQKGKCAISKQFLGTDFHCHHKIPVSKGGTDKTSNLIILHPDIHRLLHATKKETIHII